MNAQIFLWNATNYLTLLGKNPITTDLKYYGQQTTPNDIDYYNYDPTKNTGTTFNTFMRYPDENSYIYASGIAPSNAYMQEGLTYEEFKILEDYQTGTYDFMASINDGTSRGCGTIGQYFVEAARMDQTDLIAQNEERELKFHHLTAAIRIVAKRDPSTFDKIGVENISVRILNDKYTDSDGNEQIIAADKKLAVPTTITRYRTGTASAFIDKGALPQGVYPDINAWTYVAGEENTEFEALKAETSFPIPKNEEITLATFYVNSANIKYGNGTDLFDPFNYTKKTENNITTYSHNLNLSDSEATPTLYLEVTYTLTYPGTNATKQTLTKFLVVEGNVTDNGSWSYGDGVSTGSRFLPGYMYTVTLNFKPEAIALQAVLIPWVQDGPYYYSVWGEDNPEFNETNVYPPTEDQNGNEEEPEQGEEE